MPLWFVLLAIGIGFYGLSLIVRNLPKRDMHIDEEFAEDLRRQQIDAAFRTNGRALYHDRFQRGNFR